MKVITSEDNLLEFDNGLKIIGYGEEDCCAYNYLDFEQFPVGSELQTMTGEQFRDSISLKDDGFAVKDIDGIPKWVQARSSQNGYYSNRTDLSIQYGGSKIDLGSLYGEKSE